MGIDPGIIKVFGPPPPGLNLSESEVSRNNGAVIAMLCLAAVAVILRFTARITLGNALMSDDWVIVVALLCIGATAGLSIVGGTLGAGTHLWSLSLTNVSQIFRILHSYTFVYAAACASTKVSILCFYIRIFTPLDRYSRYAIAFGFFLTISYPIIIWITMGNCCRPLSFYWNQFIGEKGTCIDVNTFFLALAIINMINDFIVLLIPIPRIMKLQMTRRKKVAISAIMAVGIFACVASIVRIWYLSVFMAALDITWLMGPVFIWSTIEPSVAIICACLPHLAPFLRMVHQNVLSSRDKTGSKSHGSSGPWRGPQRNSVFGNRAPHFDGRQRLGDDEIGLTNHVAGSGNIHKADSMESTILVQSSFVQSASGSR
ncbi:pth11-like integral membrane protein [Aspergillus campestris IBT 28561]|uniref:Pth11-like integral membrane protein n=1 Tax=Aspergillus campestris (strain IBT 28561) TaxID=1392248 RepID=A0A2I1CW49_ASPC2|nr:pth11-like integral membrane protein [Aspergillus campestris IBT 28561]PKY01835.1 pth11-like integral membrane protein [Aspergillus campestris IBT 28561]